MSEEIPQELRRLARLFLEHSESLLGEWLPDGRREGNEWVARNPKRNDRNPGSFKVNLKSGEWSDFATGDKGGDLISLRSYLNGTNGVAGGNVDAAREIADRLNIGHNLDRLDWKQVKVWEYIDSEGNVLYEVVRYEALDRSGVRKKRFIQRVKNPDGTYKNSIGDIKKVPYRLHDLLEGIATGKAVFFVEGEKCVDALCEIGVVATTNPMGAKKWWPELTPYFSGADVVIIPDNDPPGKQHADIVADAIKGVAKRIRILNLPGLGEKQDVYDWIKAGGTVEDLYRLAANAPDWGNIKSAFGAIPWWNLGNSGGEYSWLIKGLLTCGERSMIAGPSKSGKSFVALDLSLAVARGVPYRGRKTKRGGVLYQAGEGGIGLKKRIKAYKIHNEIDDSVMLPFVLLPGSLDLHNGDDSVLAFIEEARMWRDQIALRFDGLPLEMIVIDTLSTATPGADENSASDMSRVLGRCKMLSDALCCHVMIVHHMNARGDKPRGHTSIFANLENVLLVEQTEDRDIYNRAIRVVTVAKQKDGADGDKWQFVLQSGIETGVDDDGEPIVSCVITDPVSRLSPGPSLRVGDGQKIAMEALRDVVLRFGRRPPEELRLPHYVRVVEWGTWRDEWRRRQLFEDDAQARSHMTRVGTKLIEGGAIGKSGNYVWLVKDGGISPDFSANAADLSDISV